MTVNMFIPAPAMQVAMTVVRLEQSLTYTLMTATVFAMFALLRHARHPINLNRLVMRNAIVVFLEELPFHTTLIMHVMWIVENVVPPEQSPTHMTMIVTALAISAMN